MAENRKEQVLGCLYATVLMKSGYRIDIGVEKDDDGKDVCHTVVSDRDNSELLILRSDNAPPNLHPDYICGIVRQVLDAAMRGKPLRELATFIEVALANLRVFIDPGDVSVVFVSVCE